MARDTRDRMLDAATRLLRERGFHGTSLNDILSRSGAPRGSLYFHFPGGKEALVCEALVREVARISEALASLFREADDPAAGMRAYIEAAAQELEESNYLFGCPVAPVVLDAPVASAALMQACRDAFDEWQRLIVEALVNGGVLRHRAESLATTSVAATEGALLLARAYRDTSPLRTVADEIEALIRQVLQQSPVR